jgi:predicted nucleic acid-binding protein
MKQIVIPDASVILKWVLKTDEDYVEKALTLLSSWVAGETEIVVPSLWVYEVGNIVGRKNAERAEEIMALLLDYRFPEARIDAGHLMASLDLMRRHAVTFYDASYHAVAMKAGGTFVTADDAYVRRAGNAGHVVSLKDLAI